MALRRASAEQRQCQNIQIWWLAPFSSSFLVASLALPWFAPPEILSLKVVTFNGGRSKAVGTYSRALSLFAAVVSAALWGIFVFVQTVRHRDYFLPHDDNALPDEPAARSRTRTEGCRAACDGVARERRHARHGPHVDDAGRCARRAVRDVSVPRLRALSPSCSARFFVSSTTPTALRQAAVERSG
jgi:Ca2+/H+ antiporter